MSYREKIAWLTLLSFVLTYGPYFTITGLGLVPAAPPPGLPQLGLFALTAVVQMLVLGAGHVILRTRMADEARCQPDERDRAISYRARNISYYILIAGMILVGCIMPFSTGGWAIVNAALFMIVVAEVCGYGLVVASYRRQA